MRYFIFIFFLIIIGCNNKNSDKFSFIALDNTEYEVTNFEFYKDGNEVYLYICNDTERQKVLNLPISSVEFTVNDTVIKAKIIGILFSKELNQNPYIIEIDDNTKTIVPINKKNKKIFYIGNKENISPSILQFIENRFIEL